ncbi:hypothetical protein SAMN05660443_0228 [Marinospirillum celere]|uniref:Uncharacterized protein n=1 Tax=Marinospirillum celere TaxID=1122252 RepID=A0A1I1E134_9GAMM|nr:hypothetical protein [Marinospirillum celere]SFB80376.1 hypothetical protein SAMN05660443_0228 [Marinospirillum celere]
MQPSVTGRTPAGQTGSTERPDPAVAEQVTQAIGQVFALLQRLYPRTWDTGWKSAQEVTESKRTLFKLLAKSAPPSPACFQRLEAFIAERGGDFPPSLPDIARVLKPQPEDLGFASPESAWLTVCNNSHQHQVIRCPAIRAAVGNRWHAIRNATSRVDIAREYKAFQASYEAVINRALMGEDITPRQLLEDQSRKLQSKGRPTDSLIDRLVQQRQQERQRASG